MAVGYMMVDKKDGKEHFRYGLASKIGGVIDKTILDQRLKNAFQYKTKVLLGGKSAENNEIVVAYRRHAGNFPVIGLPVKLNDKEPYAKSITLITTCTRSPTAR